MQWSIVLDTLIFSIKYIHKRIFRKPRFKKKNIYNSRKIICKRSRFPTKFEEKFRELYKKNMFIQSFCHNTIHHNAIRKKTTESIFEKECRGIFEKIFNVKFDKIRPQWLKNPLTGKNLELDGYNPTIKTQIGYGLAFEADGKQHSFHTIRFHKTEKDFIDQLERDDLKDRICREKGILLIRIPYYARKEGLEEFIRMRITEKLWL